MNKKAGFTLIEVIVTLILVGIMASVAGMGIITGLRGYLFAKDNSSISQKAQLAMTRMSRTFMEVLDITTVGSSPTRVTYNRLSGGANIQETMYVDTGDHSVKIVAGGNASGGDTLVDNVGSLTLTYQKGSATWVQGTDAFPLLSTVIINLALTRPDGGNNATFATVVSPRNNGNRGGSTATTIPNPQTGCFVTTAGFEQPDQPRVRFLKGLQAGYPATWSDAKMMITTYYADGPYLAALVRDGSWASALAWLCLLPLAGLASLVLYAPQALPLVLLFSWALTTILLKFIRRNPKMMSFRMSNQKGSILIGLIVTMVIFSVLAVAMLSLTTGSTFSQIHASSSTRAYYLAEAGMRFAASEFRSITGEDAKDEGLEALHNTTFDMGGDGEFHLEMYPYYFKTTSDPSTTMSLDTKFPGGTPSGPDWSIPPSGYLKIRSEETPRHYSSRTTVGSAVTFGMDANLPSYTVRSNVLFVGQARSASTDLSMADTERNLTLSSGAGFFPAINGTFTIGTASSTRGTTSDVYVYKRRNGSVLEGISRSQAPDQAFSVSVPASAFITSMKFVNVQSRGTYAQGTALEATRTVSYSVPIGWVTGAGTGGKNEFIDTFEDLSHWFTGSGEQGTHEIATVDSNKALDVTGTASPWWDIFALFERASLLTLNWGSTGADLNQSWSLADHLLSYDTQVKIRARSSSGSYQDYYMPGIVFRVNTDGTMYGISYLRANTGTTWLGADKDRVPDELCPLNTTPMIVLWQETPADTLKWLAYKTLATGDGVVNSSGQLVDWSTLLVRVIEADSLQFDSGGPGTTGVIRYGDTITGATSGSTAVVNGTPILTSGDWSTHNAAGWLTVTNVTKSGSTIQFQSGENLTVAGTVRARYTGTSRQKDNYIRVYYGNTGSMGTANANPLDNNRRSNPRISTAVQLNWPVDDVADWAATNDALTLVQWNSNINSAAGAVRLGTGSEPNAIIRTNALTTPSSGTFTRPEIGLDTWGSSSTNIYFDDFGLQTAAPGQTQGFLPAIQQ